MSDGTIFEGEFKDGRLNGKGKITYPSGKITEGKYKDGILIEKWNWVNINWIFHKFI